jgi:hypothetical protein
VACPIVPEFAIPPGAMFVTLGSETDEEVCGVGDWFFLVFVFRGRTLLVDSICGEFTRAGEGVRRSEPSFF